MRVSAGALLLALAQQIPGWAPRIDGVGGWDIMVTIHPTSQRRTLAVTSRGAIVELTKEGHPLLIAATGHICRGKPLIIRVDRNNGILLGEQGRRNVKSAFNEMLTGEKAVISFYRRPCRSTQYSEVNLEGFVETIEKLKTLPPGELDTLAASIIEERKKPRRTSEKTDPKKTLLNAARDGDLAKVMAMLALGVDVNVRTESNGYTPLIWASAQGHAEVVHTLLGGKADVNAQAKDLQTALMKACEKGHLEVVAPLLGAGADVNARTEQGITALNLALRSGHQEIVDLLRYVGAKE